jgi:hypothetical protein
MVEVSVATGRALGDVRLPGVGDARPGLDCRANCARFSRLRRLFVSANVDKVELRSVQWDAESTGAVISGVVEDATFGERGGKDVGWDAVDTATIAAAPEEAFFPAAAA